MSKKEKSSPYVQSARPGLKSLSSLTPAITREALRDQKTFLPRLKAYWDEIVGPMLARLTEPEDFRFHTLREGTKAVLILASEPVAALEVQHMIPQIIQKIGVFNDLSVPLEIKVVQKNLNKPLQPRRKEPLIKTYASLSPQISADLETVENETLREALKKLALHASS